MGKLARGFCATASGARSDEAGVLDLLGIGLVVSAIPFLWGRVHVIPQPYPLERYHGRTRPSQPLCPSERARAAFDSDRCVHGGVTYRMVRGLASGVEIQPSDGGGRGIECVRMSGCSTLQSPALVRPASWRAAARRKLPDARPPMPPRESLRDLLTQGAHFEANLAQSHSRPSQCGRDTISTPWARRYANRAPPLSGLMNALQESG